MNRESSEKKGRTGLTVLSLVVLLAAIWISIQQRQHPTPSVAQPVPPLQISPGLARFRAEAWYLPNDDLLGFVKIPAGVFVMGSDPKLDRSAFANERWSQNQLQGKVELPTFYLGRYEVTIAQYRVFVEATGQRFEAQTLKGDGDRPVANVSWTDALAYCRWLTNTLKTSAQTPTQLAELVRDGWQVDLPTEAQWEKAARSGDARIYPWGNAPNREHANFASQSVLPVGSFRCDECAYGLADMSGNVWELTRSPMRAYPFDSANQRVDPNAEALFVMRGGSYMDTETNVRAATRGGIDPGARRPFIGFRLALVK